MITAIWSDDPEFYEAILGGNEFLEHIFVKMNYTDTNQIIERFNLLPISDGAFARSDSHKYICVTMEDAQTAISKVKEIKAAV